MKTIHVTVMPDGSTKIETKGFVGSECRDASQFLEKALGKPTAETLKPEFHQAISQQQQQASE